MLSLVSALARLHPPRVNMAPNDAPPLIIRRAGPDDLAAATALVEKAWTASNAEFLPALTMALLTAENSVAGLMASRSQELWLAESSEEITAVLGADANGYIWACYVHPKAQRSGVGTALMAKVKAYFADKGLDNLHLDIIEENEAACAFYEHLGWTEESRRDEKLPGHIATAIRMTCSL